MLNHLVNSNPRWRHHRGLSVFCLFVFTFSFVCLLIRNQRVRKKCARKLIFAQRFFSVLNPGFVCLFFCFVVLHSFFYLFRSVYFCLNHAFLSLFCYSDRDNVGKYQWDKQKVSCQTFMHCIFANITLSWKQ